MKGKALPHIAQMRTTLPTCSARVSFTTYYCELRKNRALDCLSLPLQYHISANFFRKKDKDCPGADLCGNSFFQPRLIILARCSPAGPFSGSQLEALEQIPPLASLLLSNKVCIQIFHAANWISKMDPH